MFKILIELPTWMGDCVMSTPAIENIVKLHPNAQITIFGSEVSVEILKNHPNVVTTVVDDSRKAKYRFLHIYRKAKNLGSFDLALSFRRTFTSKLFIWFSIAKQKGYYKRYTKKIIHQCIRYNDFVNTVFKSKTNPGKPVVYQRQGAVKKNNKSSKLLGINPGASYGSAKRWYPKRFAQVATNLSNKYDIIIFGGPDEKDIAQDIETFLKKNKVNNYLNLAGKTSISELKDKISNLDLFITGDSGPMHLASAFQIPTVAIFGPTKHNETSQWLNHQSTIVRKNLECQPCMKRSCPLNHHNCMKLITSSNVLDSINQLDLN